MGDACDATDGVVGSQERSKQQRENKSEVAEA
jgi:hypothetical protein